MSQIILRNVHIEDLMQVLSQLAENYTVVDVVSDPERGTLILNPVEPAKPPKLTVDYIEKLL